MGKTERQELIRKIEQKRNSKVICYFVGDRPHLSFQIAGDIIRKIYDHLKSILKNQKLDLILYSIGGDASVPWRLVSLIREFSSEFNVIIPSHAFSATTMISLGADSIIMCDKGELGPIDPAVTSEFNPIDEQRKTYKRINVEDVTAYISLIKEKVDLRDQNAIAEIFKSLTEKINPLALGYVNRHHSFIRMVARKLLSSHNTKLPEETIEKIVENLIEKIYFHGHSINRKEAKELGLKVEHPDEELQQIIWDLYLEYEKEMKLTSTFVPEDVLEDVKSDEHVEKNVIAVYLESSNKTDRYMGDVKVERIRKIPQNINFNLNLQLPPGIDQQKIDPKLVEQIYQQIQKLVIEQIRIQSPVEGYSGRNLKFHWEEE